MKSNYKDKSVDQPEMKAIFEDLKLILSPYERGESRWWETLMGQMFLINSKPVEISGRLKSEMVVRVVAGSERLCWILFYASLYSPKSNSFFARSRFAEDGERDKLLSY